MNNEENNVNEFYCPGCDRPLLDEDSVCLFCGE